MDQKIVYSIITPVYNREDCISRCIDSVISQLKLNITLEHIIVDDGSEDNTSLIIQDYAKKYTHIRFIQFLYNKGTNAARNEAIKAAKGEYCIILDSDDFFVDRALEIINNTRKLHCNYSYYLFAPDDKLDFFNKNSYLSKFDELELCYKDFLLDKINTDFIHVCETRIMKMYPFDESLRIYEGVFFLRFYKEAQKIFFMKKVIAIRERSRDDSVTRTVLRTNNDAIKKRIISNNLFLEWFGEDFIKYKAFDRLQFILSSLYQNYILLGDYKKAKSIENRIRDNSFCIDKKYFIIHKFKLGFLMKVYIRIGLIIKYNMLKKQLK